LKHRWLIVGLALFAAAALAVSVQAGRWWSIRGGADVDERSEWGSGGGAGANGPRGVDGDIAVDIGPFGSHSALRGAGGLSWAGGGPRWERFGAATWAGGMIAMFVMVVVAGGVAARRVPRLAALTALVAIATAALVAIGFVVTRPTAMPFEPDRGIVLFVVGAVAGAVVALAVLRAWRAKTRATSSPGT
jgi:hypothetical protein